MYELFTTPFVLVVSATFSLSVYYVLSARILRAEPRANLLTQSKSTIGDPMFLQGATHLFAGLFLFTVLLLLPGFSYKNFFLPVSFFLLVIFAALPGIFSKIFHFEALRRSDVAYVASFAAVSPVISIVTGWMYFNELPTVKGAVGLVIIVAGLLGLHGCFSRAFWCQFGKRSVLRPFLTSGSFFAFLSSCCPAIGIVFAKDAILHANVGVYLVYSFVVIGLSLLTIAALSERLGKTTKLTPLMNFRRELPTLFLLSLFLVGGGYPLATAVSLGRVAHINAMSRLSIVFQVILAFFFANQRTEIARRLSWALLIFIGVVVIGFAG